ncbi:hypothetical protein BDV95DRAFT_587834 [Massariosphaeria phaeospora]|uniref:C2H2-type domain-containing protein n=1 Tax=Massariosphaeria phaeospora TaxID=100035 RepID=A0A7C8HYH8_9PLEO|nr:hypothetical protein BDV95DRAFT_587834 [Massariosphaeria phaeospora]
MDWDKKVLVPFHYLVEPRPLCSRTTPSPSFPFFRLPTDIQLIVYESCDLPTLFQLMRTCSRSRGPATKLFWANTTSGNHWYHGPNHELFEYGTRHPIIRHCQDFARSITRIELDLGRLEHSFAEEVEPHPFREPASTATKAQYFWSSLGRAFPAVKKAVLTSMLPRRPLPPRTGEFDATYSTIETVVNLAPSHVVVHVAFDDAQSKRRRYTLWQVANSTKPTWQVLDEDWTPIRILLLPRKFAASPLGDLVTMTRKNLALLLERRGLHWLLIETYARYALNGKIHCPRLDCDATFAERSQWTKHLNDTQHRRLGPVYGYKDNHMMELLCFKGTPDAEQAAMEARQQRIDAGYRRTRILKQRVGWGWGDEGTEQRRLFEKQFFAQLREENLVAPGKLIMDPDQPMCDWIDCLHMYYDPTHVYY